MGQPYLKGSVAAARVQMGQPYLKVSLAAVFFCLDLLPDICLDLPSCSDDLPFELED
jgi:hypothetical protein